MIQWVSKATARKLLGWDRQRFHYHCQLGRLDHIKREIDGIVFYDREQLLAWEPPDERTTHGKKKRVAQPKVKRLAPGYADGATFGPTAKPKGSRKQ